MAELVIVVALGLIALAAVAYPLLAGHHRFPDAGELDAEVVRYREALAAGSLCTRCRFANPADSRYCADCGRPLTDEG